MAVATATSSIFSFFSIFMSTFLYLLHPCIAHTGSRYDVVYQFGDSLSDTGNYIRLTPTGASSVFTRLPYGVTYFNKPTGRCSDGRLMNDFLAQELGLPLLEPYLRNDSSHFHHGVNFAVAAATALDRDFLKQYNITIPNTTVSLHGQLDWFFSHLDSICSNKTDECDEKIKKALFVVGEIGANDYGFPFFEGKSINQVKYLVPFVVRSIRHAIKKLIERGATRLIVPGNFAMGCFPTALTVFKSSNSTYYDDTNCLKDYNEFAEYHNEYLKATLTKLSKENPDIVIVYADYYNAFQSIIRNNSGSENKLHVLEACCGAGGNYNMDMEKPCGVQGASSCPDPTKYVSWDGTHFTDMGFQLMFKWILKNNLSLLKI